MILALDLSSTSTGVCFDGTTSTKHTHDGDALTIGCPECIHVRHRDQLRASWAEMSKEELLTIWGRCDLTGDDDVLLGRVLIERGALSVDEVAAIYPEIADEEEVA